MEEIELRCPVGPRRLLARTILSGERVHIDGDNLVELACEECKKGRRVRGEADVVRVTHRFNLVGEVVETSVLRSSA